MERRPSNLPVQYQQTISRVETTHAGHGVGRAASTLSPSHNQGFEEVLLLDDDDDDNDISSFDDNILMESAVEETVASDAGRPNTRVQFGRNDTSGAGASAARAEGSVHCSSAEVSAQYSSRRQPASGQRVGPTTYASAERIPTIAPSEPILAASECSQAIQDPDAAIAADEASTQLESLQPALTLVKSEEQPPSDGSATGFQQSRRRSRRRAHGAQCASSGEELPSLPATASELLPTRRSIARRALPATSYTPLAPGIAVLLRLRKEAVAAILGKQGSSRVERCLQRADAPHAWSSSSSSASSGVASFMNAQRAGETLALLMASAAAVDGVILPVSQPPGVTLTEDKPVKARRRRESVDSDGRVHAWVRVAAPGGGDEGYGSATFSDFSVPDYVNPEAEDGRDSTNPDTHHPQRERSDGPRGGPTAAGAGGAASPRADAASLASTVPPSQDGPGRDQSVASAVGTPRSDVENGSLRTPACASQAPVEVPESDESNARTMTVVGWGGSSRPGRLKGHRLSHASPVLGKPLKRQRSPVAAATEAAVDQAARPSTLASAATAISEPRGQGRPATRTPLLSRRRLVVERGALTKPASCGGQRSICDVLRWGAARARAGSGATASLRPTAHGQAPDPPKGATTMPRLPE